MRDRLLIEIEDVLAPIPMDFGGGCTVDKAYVMAWVIRRFHLSRTLDIGVYRGRSFFPQAVAHRLGAGGIAYGVDPWCAEENDEQDYPELREEMKAWVESADFDGFFNQVMDTIRVTGLSKNAEIIRTTSEAAAAKFVEGQVSFGLIHIDGNHDTAAVLRDVRLYLPLLQPGGFIVMDDVSWESVKPAVREVSAQMRLVFNCVAHHRGNDYAVFWKGGSWTAAAALGAKLRIVSRVYSPVLRRLSNLIRRS